MDMSNRTDVVINEAMALLRSGHVIAAVDVLERLRVEEEQNWSGKETASWNLARSFAANMAGNYSEASHFAEQAALVRPDEAFLWHSSAHFAEQAKDYKRCTFLLSKARCAATWWTDEDTRRMCEEMETRMASLIKDEDSHQG